MQIQVPVRPARRELLRTQLNAASRLDAAPAHSARGATTPTSTQRVPSWRCAFLSRAFLSQLPCPKSQRFGSLCTWCHICPLSSSSPALLLLHNAGSLGGKLRLEAHHGRQGVGALRHDVRELLFAGQQARPVPLPAAAHDEHQAPSGRVRLQEGVLVTGVRYSRVRRGTLLYLHFVRACSCTRGPSFGVKQCGVKQ